MIPVHGLPTPTGLLKQAVKNILIVISVNNQPTSFPGSLFFSPPPPGKVFVVVVLCSFYNLPTISYITILQTLNTLELQYYHISNYSITYSAQLYVEFNLSWVTNYSLILARNFSVNLTIKHGDKSEKLKTIVVKNF